MKKLIPICLVALFSVSAFAQQYTVSVSFLQRQPVVSLRATTPTIQLENTIDNLFSNVYSRLDALGYEATGAPFVRYYSINAGITTLEAGVPVAFHPAGIPFEMRNYLPGGQVASTVHYGSGALIDNAYNAIETYMYRYGKFDAGAAWEIYLDDTDTTPLHLQRTQVVQPISGIAP